MFLKGGAMLHKSAEEIRADCLRMLRKPLHQTYENWADELPEFLKRHERRK
jgi:hypothetical protein